MATIADLENRFTYHPPNGPAQVQLYEFLRRSALQFALTVNQITPEGREQEIALMHIQAAVMFANAGIACGQPSAREGQPSPNDTDPELPTYDPESPAGRYEAYRRAQVDEAQTNG